LAPKQDIWKSKITNVFEQPYREYKLSNIDPLTGKERRKPKQRMRPPILEEPLHDQKVAPPPPTPKVNPRHFKKKVTPPLRTPTAAPEVAAQPVYHKTVTWHPKVIDRIVLLSVVALLIN